MSGNGIKYEKADVDLPLATAEAVVVDDGNEHHASNNLVTAIFDKPTKDSPLGIIWNIVNNEIVLTGFAKAGLAMTQPNNLEIGMTLMSVNGVSFVSGMAAIGHHPEDVFADEEEGPSSMGLVTEEAAVEASNIMRNAEGTLIIVARKNTKSAKSARNHNINKKHNKRNVKKMTKANPPSSAPPPGAPEGGVWGSTLYYGPTSQLSSILCCLLGGLIPASIMCCLPFDKRRVYFANNRYYGEFGGVLGVGGDLRFLQEDPMRGTYNSDAATSSCCMAFWFIAVVIFIMILMQTSQAQQANGYYHL